MWTTSAGSALRPGILQKNASFDVIYECTNQWEFVGKNIAGCEHLKNNLYFVWVVPKDIFKLILNTL